MSNDATPITLRSAQFADLNKQNTLADYQREVNSGDYHVANCSVTEVLVLTNEDWDEFTTNLLSDNPLIAGKGGTGSTADLPDVEGFFDYTEEQRAEFIAHAYNLVVSVQAPDRPEIFVDPQGYDYARYVGIPLS